ncbi:MAG TPA: prepilin-type N-terminal cleavage/methylation domain-containing protein [Phycisphaerae bacterium]|nr:prepilin-type N-terminal cleavage/methylation domain-containing protein [Phycisphaerae bacterium]
MNQNSSYFPARRAFTLIEMMVAVSILVVIILAVGVTFQGASRSIGVSQSSLEMLSNVRAVQQQIAKDVEGIDKDGFLVIRCGVFTDTHGVVRRCDQICFFSRGSFQHRTGSAGGASISFTDSTTSPSAFVWWGQLAMERPNGTAPDGVPTAENTTLGLDQIPTPARPVQNSPTQVSTEETSYVLGRSAMLLFPQNAIASSGSGGGNISPGGVFIPAFYPSSSTNLSAIDYYYPSITASNGHWWKLGTETADITQSRLDAAATSIDGIMRSLRAALGYPNTRNIGGSNTYTATDPNGTFTNSNNRYEADHFCYRRGALSSPYDGTSLVNGYFRMHPMALQGVSSLAIDWTDGSVYKEADANMAPPGTYTQGSSASAAVDITTQKLIGKPTVAIPTSEPFDGSTRWYGMCDLSGQPNNNDIVAFARGPLPNPPTAPPAAPIIVAHNSTTTADPDFAAVPAANKKSDPYVDNGLTSDTTPLGTITTRSVNPDNTKYVPPAHYTSGDLYTAIFSHDTPRTFWPVALRFRYHVADPTGRLPNGRDFVQIIRLPTE